MKLARLLLVMIACGLATGATAQTTADYRPDTMALPSFLTQCQSFVQGQQEEMWVVAFWASWNSNSLYHLSPLKAMYYNFRHKPIRFFFVSRDQYASTWLTALNREQLPGTHILVNQPEDYDYLKRGFQHSSIPAMFLVDQEGNIFRVERVEQLQEMLSESAAALPSQPSGSSTYPPMASNPSARPTLTPSTDPQSFPSRPTSSPDAGSDSGSDEAFLTHTVRKGDTLFSLSRKYEVRVADIRDLNSLDGNLIKVGQTLKIKVR